MRIMLLPSTLVWTEGEPALETDGSVRWTVKRFDELDRSERKCLAFDESRQVWTAIMPF